MPKEKGGLALLHPWSYFVAAQLQHLQGCALKGGSAWYSGRELLTCTPHSMLVEALEAGSLRSESPCPTVHQLLLKLWWIVCPTLHYIGFIQYTPIWDNQKLLELIADFSFYNAVSLNFLQWILHVSGLPGHCSLDETHPLVLLSCWGFGLFFPLLVHVQVTARTYCYS